MSARGLSMIALGVALAVLTALNFFRSEEPVIADVDPSLAEQHGEAEVRVAPSQDPREDAIATEERDAAVVAPPTPASLPSTGPYTSISAALEHHDLPPERRIKPTPEMLETERAFAAENEDASWSTAAEASVLAGFAEIPGLSLVSLNIECRTTLCLLQLGTPQAPPPNYPNPNIAEIVGPAGLKPLWQMGIRANGAPVLMAYLERAEPAPP